VTRNLFGRLWDRFVVGKGHRCIGCVTMYAFDTAMHGAVNVHTRRWGAVCFAWPRLGGRRSWPAYFYLSPNCTPWASTLLIGREYTRDERRMARVRCALWGHGYDAERLDPQVLDRAVRLTEERDDSSLRQVNEIIRDRRGWIAR
jgi:hypothetical protein